MIGQEQIFVHITLLSVYNRFCHSELYAEWMRGRPILSFRIVPRTNKRGVNVVVPTKVETHRSVIPAEFVPDHDRGAGIRRSVIPAEAGIHSLIIDSRFKYSGTRFRE